MPHDRLGWRLWVRRQNCPRWFRPLGAVAPEFVALLEYRPSGQHRTENTGFRDVALTGFSPGDPERVFPARIAADPSQPIDKLAKYKFLGIEAMVEFGKVLPHDLPDDIEVDAEVAVGKAVAEGPDLGPGNEGFLGLDAVAEVEMGSE